MNQKLLSVAKGETPADLVIRNGKVVNVYSGEIYDGGVAICGDTIAAVGDVEYCIGEGTRVVDAEGKYLTPGFLDGHIHPESSSLAIRPFAEAVLAHGTTGIMTDLHEVGVVSGLEGIEAILKEAEATDLKIYFVVPSHVPFSPNLETSVRTRWACPSVSAPISQPGSPICWSPLTPRCLCPARPCRAICRICTARP